MSSIPAEISIRFMTPMSAAKKVGIDGPTIAPRLAPLAMIANNRGACSFEKVPDMKLQKTETWKRLNTLSHT